jgi:two-component system response regulator RegA
MLAPRPDLPRLLLVDDDPTLSEVLARALEGRGFAVQRVHNGTDALALIEARAPEYAVVDLRLSDMSGLEVLQRLKAADDRANVVVLTGYGSIATAVEAVRHGAIDYLTKPVDADEILLAFGARAGSAAAPATPSVQVPSLHRVEWEHIQRVLADCGGNVSEAARKLGMHRRTLQRKLATQPPGK